jgi:hypothetical protein
MPLGNMAGERIAGERIAPGLYAALCPACAATTTILRQSHAAFRVLQQCRHAAGVSLPKLGTAGGAEVIFYPAVPAARGIN